MFQTTFSCWLCIEVLVDDVLYCCPIKTDCFPITPVAASYLHDHKSKEHNMYRTDQWITDGQIEEPFWCGFANYRRLVSRNSGPTQIASVTD